MLKELVVRIKQGYHTNGFPKKIPQLPEKFAGYPIIEKNKCKAYCKECISNCPVKAVSKADEKISIDTAKCIFCKECEHLCPSKKIRFSQDYRLSAGTRDDLIKSSDVQVIADFVRKDIQKIFGRSLKLRQVSAGGCNACEADINVLGTIGWDLGRFGIQFVASPRHADGIIVTGPVTKNMKLALRKTHEAIAYPKIVIAVGACAISGGIYENMETCNGVDSLLKVDLYIPGCPPHPLTILDALLRLTGKIK